MILNGFDSDTFDSQIVFRQILLAMASPGTIVDIGIDLVTPETIHSAAGAILLALLDFETPLWSDLENTSSSIQWLRFHTGAAITRLKQNAMFALVTDYDNFEYPALFNPGTIESPDISTTMIVQTRGLDDISRIKLTGPGIKNQTFLRLNGIREKFWSNRSELYNIYPLGVDMIFVCDTNLVAIPRTTKVEIL
ncbi:MAG: phosphonate C-P lyase system protein PhnH [Pseudomonadota bacterium]